MKHNTIGIILVAGGKGTRLGGGIPKVFRLLKGQPVVQYSYALFANEKRVDEIVIVAEEKYHPLFSLSPPQKPLAFAPPGTRRQDSVYNGLQALSSTITSVVVHDAARPFVTQEMLHHLIAKGEETGAAALAIPLSFTIRECTEEKRGIHTPNREAFWEMQTPQYVRRDWLEKGLEKAYATHTTLTDDIAAAELLGHPIYVVEGSARNRKITLPEDWSFAEYLLSQNE